MGAVTYAGTKRTAAMLTWLPELVERPTSLLLAPSPAVKAKVPKLHQSPFLETPALLDWRSTRSVVCATPEAVTVKSMAPRVPVRSLYFTSTR